MIYQTAFTPSTWAMRGADVVLFLILLAVSLIQRI
jgi:hypothetical protein